MWHLAYNLLLLAASPLILLVLLAKKRCRRGLLQRLGMKLPAPAAGGRPVLWVHAVSLGEAVAVAPLVTALARRYPDFRIVVSTVTETGREAVQQRLAGVAEHCYAPLDFPWTVAGFVGRLQPRLFLFVETELWPNLLRGLGRRGVPAVLVNGRLSSRSFRRYRLIRPFLAQVLDQVTACLMQSARDAERMVALGASPDRVLRSGNIKFDQPLPLTAGQNGASRRTLGLADNEELLVAGSTHPGEEEEILSAYKKLSVEFHNLVLVLAPRHIERAGEAQETARAFGFTVSRRTMPGALPMPAQGPRVIVLDSRGELAALYGEATLAFVGGTLVPVGGHNLLEPAAWGKPVFFGPHTDHCAEIAAQLSEAGGGIRVKDGADLAVQMIRLLKDRATARTVGEAARSVIEENRGALQRSLEEISRILDGTAASPTVHSAASVAGAPRQDALAHTPVER